MHLEKSRISSDSNTVCGHAWYQNVALYTPVRSVVQRLCRLKQLRSVVATHVMHNPIHFYAYFTYGENITALLIIYFRMRDRTSEVTGNQ